MTMKLKRGIIKYRIGCLSEKRFRGPFASLQCAGARLIEWSDIGSIAPIARECKVPSIGVVAILPIRDALPHCEECSCECIRIDNRDLIKTCPTDVANDRKIVTRNVEKKTIEFRVRADDLSESRLLPFLF